MFSSRSLPEHLLRGAFGLGAFVAAVSATPLHPWLALAALLLGFVLLRGCPTCWLVGLVETLAPGLGEAGRCVDGSCAKRSMSKD